MKSFNRSKSFRSFLHWSVAIVLPLFFTSCVYMKMAPPPDADKALPIAGNDDSCWTATASNMLAGAGYGSGNTVQNRADDIYNDMTNQFGLNSGWTDTALTWWLNSNHNTWTNNPYTDVQVHGNKIPRYPWANANGARFIGNELRRCQFVGLSISWPTNAAGAIGSGGHAITAWGDASGQSTLISNPSVVRVTNSDRDTGGDVQQYTYDSYTSPNPGGANEGNGWYINYDNNHPYIKHIVTLCPTDDPSDNKLTQKVVGSTRIHQKSRTSATDLHYNVGTDVSILSYKTSVSWPAQDPPKVTENRSPPTKLEVDWDFKEKPVPYCTWVTITTEFMLPAYNAIEYSNVRFTYPDRVIGEFTPSIKWEMKTPTLEKAESIPDVCGGYVVGAFDVLDSRGEIAVEHRFIHQYSFTQSPEKHVFVLDGERGYLATNFRFGHSYGLPGADTLWEFKDWMTVTGEKRYPLAEGPVKMSIDWKGRLPYPKGEDIRGRIPDIKGGLLTDRPPTGIVDPR